MTTKLEVNNLTQQAYDLLREKITSKEIPSGTRLVDSTLAKEYGISRTPLRDAIRKLAEDGLVTPSPTKGFFVFEPSVKDIEEIFEFRQMLDIEVVTKLITRILPENPSVFEYISKSYQNGLKHSSISEDFVQSDEDFHDSIMALSGNSRMIKCYADLHNQTRLFRKRTSQDPKKMQQANDYHKNIYEGIKNLDLTMTITAIKAHIEYSKLDAIKQFIAEDSEH